MNSYTVILDACVLYPAPLRSYLMYLSNTGLFRARWTNEIHEEWIRNLLKNNPSIEAEKLDKIRMLMDKNVPDALVNGYEVLIDGLELPDEDDRHVLAAAIKGNAEGIITFNLKDFPEETLNQYDISAIHPDIFLSDMFELDPAKCLQAAQQQRRSLKNPPFSSEEYLNCLLNQKLPSFAKHLRAMSFAL